MQSTPSPVNIVLLFADEDEAWRVVLLNHLSDLKREGQITLWDVSHIAAGTDRVKATRQHLERAAVILLLVSAACLSSHDREIEQAMRRQMSGDVLIIPILLHPVDWHNTRLARFQPLPGNFEPISTWQSQDAAFAEVVVGIRRALPEALHLAARTPSSTLPPIWNVPYARNPVFTGREEILKRVESQLQKGTAMALSQAQAISGLGGIGKTQIAVEYAYRHRNDYEAVLWVLSDTRESLVSGYIALAELLDLPEKEDKEQEITIEAAKNWLQTHDSWLLILDNADDLTLVREFIPPTFGGHILLTTRAWTMGKLAKRIEVETMTADTGALLLLRRAGLVEQDAPLDTASSSDVAVAREICEELGGLPLAIDQAGAYIEESQCSLSQYLERYREERAVLLAHRGGGISDHSEPVATTWSLSFQKVEEQSPGAANLLRLCAFLHPDAIPEEMITRNAASLEALQEKKTRGWLAGLSSLLGKGQASIARKQDRFLLDESVRVLSTYSLIHRNAREQTLSIHRLVQAVLKDTMDEPTQKQWAERAVQAVNAVFPERIAFAVWAQCERYLPHVLVCAELVEQERIRSLEAARLFYETGQYLIERARVSEAYPLLQQALVIREHHLGPEHNDTASVVDRLAQCFKDQGKYEQAEPLYQHALTICEQQLGAKHPDTATSLNNLAGLYKTQGKYEQAKPLYERALAIREQQLGANHPDTATSLNNLAELYRVQGKYEQAEPLYQRALEIKEQQLGPMHPSTATSLNNLALLYKVQGKYEQAEPLYERALAISEQQLGANHPDTATSLNNLAGLYRAQGKYEQAEPLYQRALAIYEQQLGANHPDTARSLNNLASLYSDQGKYEQAEPLYQRALEIKEQQLGANHPATATSLNNLAGLYKVQGKYEQAEPLHKRALAITERQLGEMHPSTATRLHNLATLYDEQGKYETAEQLFKRALLICEQTLGKTHPNTQDTRGWYVQLLRKTGRDKEATALEQGQLPSDEH